MTPYAITGSTHVGRLHVGRLVVSSGISESARDRVERRVRWFMGLTFVAQVTALVVLIRVLGFSRGIVVFTFALLPLGVIAIGMPIYWALRHKGRPG